MSEARYKGVNGRLCLLFEKVYDGYLGWTMKKLKSLWNWNGGV